MMHDVWVYIIFQGGHKQWMLPAFHMRQTQDNEGDGTSVEGGITLIDIVKQVFW